MSKFHPSQKIKLLAVGAILFAFGVATSAVATTAWYNLLDIAVVSNLNLKIDMKDAKLELGMTSKVNGERIWSGDEDHPDGFSTEELGIDGTILNDVSGMYESDWLNDSTDLSTALPRFHTRYRPGMNNFNTGFISDEEAEKNIVQLEFFFYSELYDMDVYLDNSTSFSPNTKMNYDKAKEKADDPNDENEVYQIKDKLDKVIYATRMSFLSDEGYIIVNPYKGLDVIGDVETYYGGILDLNKDGFYDYRDGKEVLYGELIDDTIPVPYSGVGNSEDDYKKDVKKYNTFQGEHKKDIQMVNENSVKENIRVENSKSLKQVAFDTNDPFGSSPICHIKKGEEPKRVVMSIYVEGWDRHMTDDIASATFDVNIAFTGLVKN
ncbi:MAG: hypothetical protein K6C32_04865 [Bacilli bacterium]|nr:hypothetical protein [Bacilli bacterium]